MRKRQRPNGFTLAEMLIVVAIIGVLAGVSFIAVERHQRNLAQLEVENIAKEIFIAAQNHLTMAENEGYLGANIDNSGQFGRQSGSSIFSEDDESIYYLRFDSGLDPEKSNYIWELMLPFGAIDETVRAGGSYIIRYQPSAALVLDVFYCSKTGRFKENLDLVDYASLMSNYREIEKRSARRNYNGGVIGWYGGEQAAELAKGETLKAPVIEVENAEKLRVRVSDPNAVADYAVALIVRGRISGAQQIFELGKKTSKKTTENGRIRDPEPGDDCDYVVILDSVTDLGLHFASLESKIAGKKFIPGEDIVVQAVAYNTAALTNIAYSDEKITNSLFERADNANDDADSRNKPITAYINNIRHLENLDNAISGVKYIPTEITGGGVSQIVGVNQTTDLDWKDFAKKLDGDNTTIYQYTDSTDRKDADKGLYLPVNLKEGSRDYSLNYQGDGHSISNLTVNTASDAGLFGALSDGGSVSDLALIDFSVTSTGGSAGVLAGTVTNTAVSNVIAYHTGDGNDKKVTATGNAGGLIGSMSGGSVEKCGAALTVTSTGGDAGGLIGTITGTDAKVSASYSGGHTEDGAYDKDAMNVTGAQSAGGLIGDASGATVENSYSTCSVAGATAGGLAGVAGKVTNCYATGLVAGADDAATVGAFAGKLTDTTSTGKYYEIINGDLPVIGSGSADGVTALDESVATYEAFVGGSDAWTDAAPYDAALLNYYKKEGKEGASAFDLQNVVRLGATVNEGDFVAVHHGDWPAPEIFTFNQPE